MPTARPPTGLKSGPAQRVLMFALVLSMALLLWRASEALAASDRLDQPGASNPAEYLLETLTGPGHVRVIQSGEPRSILILIDAANTEQPNLTTDQLGMLLSEAGLFAPLAGDTIAVRRVVFERADETPMAALLEIAALGLLTMVLAGVLVLDRPARASQPRQSEPLSPGRSQGRVAPQRDHAHPHTDHEAVVARVRQWLQEDAR